jgi:hypothetical protein
MAMAAVGMAGAATYYVDAGHAQSADTNDGSEAAPWKTVQHAAGQAQAGDVVLVRPGQYAEKITVKHSGAEDRLLVLRAEPSRQARVQGLVIEGDFVVIEGFEITGGKNGIFAGEAHYKNARTGCRFANNHIHDIEGTAITSGERAIVRDNRMRNVGRGFFVNSGTLVEGNEVDTLVAPLVEKDGGRWPKKTQYAFFAGEDIIFRGNHFHGSPMEQMHKWGVDFFVTWDAWIMGPSRRILIENNRCFNATHGSEPEAKQLRQSSHITYRNNLFVNTVYVGVLPKEWTHVTVENNTFINCGAYPVWFASERQCEGASVRNNLIAYWKHDQRVHGGPPAESGVAVGGREWRPENPASLVACDNNLFFGCKNRGYGKNDVTAEPQFVDPDNGDFRLKPGSPGIDAGAAIKAVKTDLRGVARPQGAAYDIGAYEFDPARDGK